MYSMTGYGQATSPELQGVQWIVEIQGVNRKLLDVSIYLPKDLLYLEWKIRQKISQVIERGQVTVRISLKQATSQGKSSTSYVKTLEAIQAEWISIATHLGYPKEMIDLRFLLDRLDQLSLEDLSVNQEHLHSLLEKTLTRAIAEFLEVKKTWLRTYRSAWK
jgi:uncharacterized protein (TIGR00255 family)